ncbi:cbb3-type cytochrome c oxidase subunit 3 [Flavobacteriaceae bacterium Ap0902]|nr:cbb3-type cytochrome c oxidase subunit 3 [Flavobacteriaceae bacterium Ap0902]
MLKYYKEFLSNYEYAAWIQTAILIASVAFFVLLVYLVLNKPKNYYKNTSELPLEDDDPLF